MTLLTAAHLAHILQPGAHAHMPLVDRIGQLKIPVTFICEPVLSPTYQECSVDAFL
jgi:hypothetical protein